ncbi:hypothetical protein PIB30_087001, partial [Stylosanthes scabra]|nr:hypothetical protein [Stylosanthes scabra]
HLNLSRFDKVKRIDLEFYKDNESSSSSCGAPFPMLETLYFSYMYCLEGWLSVSYEVELDAFPRLRSLKLECCPALKGDLPGQLPALKRLWIHRCGRLAFTLPRVDAILDIYVKRFKQQQMEVIFEAIACNQLNCLQSLTILECFSSISFPTQICLPSSLQEWEIENCPYLVSFPRTCLPSSLQKLVIHDCPYVTMGL